MTLNEDEYQKSVQLNLDVVIVNYFYASIQAYWRRRYTLQSAIFAHFRPSRPWPWIGSYGIPSCITHRPPGKTLCTDIRTISSTRGVDLIITVVTVTVQLVSLYSPSEPGNRQDIDNVVVQFVQYRITDGLILTTFTKSRDMTSYADTKDDWRTTLSEAAIWRIWVTSS